MRRTRRITRWPCNFRVEWHYDMSRIVPTVCVGKSITSSSEHRPSGYLETDPLGPGIVPATHSYPSSTLTPFLPPLFLLLLLAFINTSPCARPSVCPSHSHSPPLSRLFHSFIRSFTHPHPLAASVDQSTYSPTLVCNDTPTTRAGLPASPTSARRFTRINTPTQFPSTLERRFQYSPPSHIHPPQDASAELVRRLACARPRRPRHGRSRGESHSLPRHSHPLHRIGYRLLHLLPEVFAYSLRSAVDDGLTRQALSLPLTLSSLTVRAHVVSAPSAPVNCFTQVPSVSAARSRR